MQQIERRSCEATCIPSDRISDIPAVAKVDANVIRVSKIEIKYQSAPRDLVIMSGKFVITAPQCK